MIKLLIITITVLIIRFDSTFSANEVEILASGSCGGSSPWIQKLAGMIEPVLEQCSEVSSVDEFISCGIESLGINSKVAGHAFLQEVKTIVTDTLLDSAVNTDEVATSDDSPTAFNCPCLEKNKKKVEL